MIGPWNKPQTQLNEFVPKKFYEYHLMNLLPKTHNSYINSLQIKRLQTLMENVKFWIAGFILHCNHAWAITRVVLKNVALFHLLHFSAFCSFELVYAQLLTFMWDYVLHLFEFFMSERKILKKFQGVNSRSWLHLLIPTCTMILRSSDWINKSCAW